MGKTKNLIFYSLTVIRTICLKHSKTAPKNTKYKTELPDWSWKQIVENTQLLFWKNYTGYRYANELRVAESGGGVLTLTWYTYMCLPFGALFRKIWYSDQGVFIRDEAAQIQKIGYILGQMFKSTQFGQNWVLFFRKWYIDGCGIRQKIGIEIVRFSRSGRHIHVRFWWKYPPPGSEWVTLLRLLFGV